MKFGTSPDSMSLELKDASGNMVCMMSDDAQTLGHYGAQEHFTIHVHDTSGTAVANEWDDVSKVEKYTISENDYNNREDTFRKFKKDMQKQYPGFMKPNGDSAYDDFQKDEAEKVKVEDRCQVLIGSRRGTVKYVGKVKGLGAGHWLGILSDEPLGDSDGKVAGKQIFECPAKGWALFVRPNEVDVGDFPPEDDFDSDLDEI